MWTCIDWNAGCLFCLKTQRCYAGTFVGTRTGTLKRNQKKVGGNYASPGYAVILRQGSHFVKATVLGFRDPVTGTEQIGHVVSIVQDSQARLGISMEITAFSQPLYNSSQKTGRKPPRCGLSWVTNLPKFQLVPLNVTNSGYRTPTTV